MLAGLWAGLPSMLGFSQNFQHDRPSSQPIRVTARLCLTALLCVPMLGCFPDDHDRNGRSDLALPVSNVAAKAGRLDLPKDDAAGQTYKVATTATVVPTSAPPTESVVVPASPIAPRKALAHFFEALAALDLGDRQKPVTILHLGDQHIAADRLTSELRTQFQARFGDAGRGFMAPGAFRIAGAQIRRNGNWRLASSAKGDTGPFGLTGVRMSGRNGASLHMAMHDALFDWAEITFAAGPDTGDAYVSVDNKGDTVSTRTAQPTWQRIKINAGGTTLKVQAEGDRPVELLSWVLGRNGSGVRYINLGVPGATAMTHHSWADEFVEADLERIEPDLIILGYGTNEAFNDGLDRSVYADAVRRLIDRLKSAAPEAPLLILGPPDVARLPAFALDDTDACRPLTSEERADYAQLVNASSPRLGRWHPPPNLSQVRRTLAYAAIQANALFWDWSKSMGGPCSIHAWVHSEPPLATPDHRNITAQGARKSARMLFQTLMESYERYRAAVAARAAGQ